MLDFDLAELYGVELKRLNEQVKRNPERFPGDFMFRLTPEDFGYLRSKNEQQNLTSRSAHFAFTENGVAMLSSVLNSSEAIQVNIAIMRIFTELRNFQILEHHLDGKISKLEDGTKKMFRIVFERLDSIENDYEDPDKRSKRRIGL